MCEEQAIEIEYFDSEKLADKRARPPKCMFDVSRGGGTSFPPIATLSLCLGIMSSFDRRFLGYHKWYQEILKPSLKDGGQ